MRGTNVVWTHRDIEVDVSVMAATSPEWVNLEDLNDTEFVLSTYLVEKAKGGQIARPEPSLQYYVRTPARASYRHYADYWYWGDVWLGLHTILGFICKTY